MNLNFTHLQSSTVGIRIVLQPSYADSFMTPSQKSMKTKGRSSLKDVAVFAKVSVMTVSNVINEKRNVRPQTRDRVLRAIEVLGYVPTQAGRSLRTNKQWAIGFLLVDDSGRFLTDPLIAEILAGVSATLTNARYSLVLELGRSDHLSDLSAFQRRLVDSLIVVSSGGRSAVAKVAEVTASLGVPLVFCQAGPLGEDVSIINRADYDGGMLLADHLAARSVRSVLVINTELEWFAFSERERGIRAGMKAARMDIKVETIKAASESFEDAQSALNSYIDSHPVPGAIVGLNDFLAIAAIRCLEERGHSIPDEVCVAGFNAADIVNFVKPRLTTIRENPIEVGIAAARRAISAIDGDVAAVTEVLPVTLLRGETT